MISRCPGSSTHRPSSPTGTGRPVQARSPDGCQRTRRCPAGRPALASRYFECTKSARDSPAPHPKHGIRRTLRRICPAQGMRDGRDRTARTTGMKLKPLGRFGGVWVRLPPRARRAWLARLGPGCPSVGLACERVEQRDIVGGVQRLREAGVGACCLGPLAVVSIHRRGQHGDHRHRVELLS